MSDQDLDTHFADLGQQAVGAGSTVGGPAQPPPPAEKPAGDSKPAAAPATTSDAGAAAGPSDKEIFQELEAAFDRVKTKTQSNAKSEM